MRFQLQKALFLSSRAAQVAWLGVSMLVCCAAAAESTKIAREDIEWCRIWVPGVNHTDKASILLIGDSITEAYSSVVEEELKDVAYIARLTTSKSLGDPGLLQEI